MPTYLTTSSGQTKKIARTLAKDILKRKPQKRAVVLALQGELGSGKTSFLQGLADGLGIKDKILSPTFVLMRKIQMPNAKCQIKSKCQMSKHKNFYHIDCYRLKSAREILALDWTEIIKNPQNIVAVEWAERIKSILSKDCLWINLVFVDKKTRKITMQKSKCKTIEIPNPNSQCPINDQ